MKITPPEHPTAELRYGEPGSSDTAALERELRRVGEICHQCRRCLPLCPVFPKLFDLIDATDREIEGVSTEGFEDIAEWFETLGKAEKSHAGRFQKALDELD